MDSSEDQIDVVIVKLLDRAKPEAFPLGRDRTQCRGIHRCRRAVPPWFDFYRVCRILFHTRYVIGRSEYGEPMRPSRRAFQYAREPAVERAEAPTAGRRKALDEERGCKFSRRAIRA